MTDPFAPTPKPKAHHNLVSVRLSETGRGWLQERAEQFGCTQTEIVKAALSFAASRQSDFQKVIERRNG